MKLRERIARRAAAFRTWLATLNWRAIGDVSACLLALAFIGVGLGEALSWGWGMAASGSLVFALVVMSRLLAKPRRKKQPTTEGNQ